MFIMRILLFFKKYFYLMITAVQSPSHVQLCNPIDCNMLGFPALHCLSEFAQTHVH